MKQAGFTIVELLIVVVVIAIIAAIALVAYNGAQDRARFSKMRQDLSSVRKALELYKADNNGYPNSDYCDDQTGNYQYSWCGWNNGVNNSFIPGLAPKYVAKTPTVLGQKSTRDTYLYRSSDNTNGSGTGTRYYELLRYTSDGLSGIELTDNPYRWIGDGYDNVAWGFKSDSSLTNW